MECQIRRLRKTEILFTSEASGVLAANFMKYPIYASVDMHGDTAVFKQCPQKNVTFTANVTSCGAQPLYQQGNLSYTMGKDGYTLAPYSPCY